MGPFLVAVHDITPAYAAHTRTIFRDLAPLLGRRFACGVVPDWWGEWPLAAHPGFCRLVHEGAEELLLHGYFHQRRRGQGPTTWLAEGCDEMPGLDGEETRRILKRGQRAFIEAFGQPARGFLPPAWQRGRVRPGSTGSPGVEYVMGFFSVESWAGRRVPLATSSWDCGRWRWLGHCGDGIGALLQASGRRVPTLAIHPRDVERGFRPKILRLIRELLEAGHEPSTPARLLEATEDA